MKKLLTILVNNSLIHEGTKIPRAIAPVKNGIEVYEVIYKMKWHDQSTIKASGLYYVPKNSVKNHCR